MTKKKGFALILLFSLTVAVIWFGMDYQKNQKAQLLDPTGNEASANSSTKKESSADAVGQLEDFEKKRENLSVLDYLTYLTLKNKGATVSFYGDISENETWPTAVENYIMEQTNQNVSVHRVPFPDFDSYRLLEENTAETLAEEPSDIVFFQLPVYGDQVRDISLTDSGSYLSEDYEAIKKALPEALVIFVTPNPSSIRQGDFNSRTLDYTSYLDQAITIAAENAIPLFDLHAEYEAELETNNLDLSDTLADDAKQLNVQGAEIYSKLFIEQLNAPIDTTSGL
ncbi:MAG: SGNH/GDSL hydrolase family protein [Carnobacterium sp.]